MPTCCPFKKPHCKYFLVTISQGPENNRKRGDAHEFHQPLQCYIKHRNNVLLKHWIQEVYCQRDLGCQSCPLFLHTPSLIFCFKIFFEAVLYELEEPVRCVICERRNTLHCKLFDGRSRHSRSILVWFCKQCYLLHADNLYGLVHHRHLYS